MSNSKLYTELEFWYTTRALCFSTTGAVLFNLSYILDDECEEEPLEEEIIIHADEDEVIEDSPSECCPDHCYKKFPFLAGDDDAPFWQGWGNLRLKTFQLIENKYFETAVITMILLSSLALALEDVNLPNRPILQDILYYMDRIFTVIFFIEMLIKWLALGFKVYFTNAWCWLDFVIVMVCSLCFKQKDKSSK